MNPRRREHVTDVIVGAAVGAWFALVAAVGTIHYWLG